MANGNKTRGFNGMTARAFVAPVAAFVLGVTGCASNANASDDNAKQAPVPAQTATPNVPNTTTKPAPQETNNSANTCVGRDFGFNVNGIKAAQVCLREAGYKDVTPTAWVDADNDGSEDDKLIRADGNKFALLNNGSGTLVEYK